jgi:S1-C subfamily serine protease
VLDKEGHILTNFHVIQDASRAIVTMYDGKSYPATLVGADPVNDVAVIDIDAPAENLVPVSFGDSGRLKVGMRVFAIGNPFGLERTLTTGIVSSLNRSLRIRHRTISSIIQTDAAINPGSSGGPLLDTRGRLIGMNTAIASSVGQSAGVGFAIPASLIERIVPQLITNGRVVRGDIGISRVYETDEGLLIEKLVPGGPAERAGLRGPQIIRRQDGFFLLQKIDRSAADIIVAVNGKKTPTAEEFLTIVERHKPGETVELTILRQGRTAQVKVQLGGNDNEKRDQSI